MFTLLPLPANFVSGALTYSGQLFDDFKILIFLAIGILVALGIWRAILNRKGVEDDGDDE